MRSKTHLWKRSLAAFLSFVMLLGMVPALGIAPAAWAAEGDETGESSESGNQTQQTNITGNYITLPITIRDFAADGMLFEYNEVNRKQDGYTYTKNGSLGTDYHYDPSYWDVNSEDGTASDTEDYTKIRVYENYRETVFYSGDSTWTNGMNWYCLICDSTGNILKVLPYSAVKNDDGEYDYENALAAVEGEAYSVWAWRDWSNIASCALLDEITEENKANYRITFDSSNNLYIGHAAYLNPAYVDLGGTVGTTGIRVYSSDNLTADVAETMGAWHCVVCDSNGNVVDVIGNGEAKGDAYTNAITNLGGAYSVWAWSNAATNETAYNAIACITDENKGEYTVQYASTEAGYVVTVAETRTYNEADTRGFGFLNTTANDYINNLSGENTIAGTQLVENGTWGVTTDPDPLDVTLNSDAPQKVYGATIRTNLVGPMLVDGKPIYTEAAVTYLATYMQQVMAVEEKDENGYYNTYHVMGTKMFDELGNYVTPGDPLAVYDLADMIRKAVSEDFTSEDDDAVKLGTYTESKTKFDNGGLSMFYQINTWYDAAYFLLHNTWRDSSEREVNNPLANDGYGMPIPRYNRIHLREATNENGDKCYIFNARYDDTTYDYTNGEIFNSPFVDTDGDGNVDTIAERTYTIAEDNYGNETYVRGNPLPVNRFDPLGESGAGQNWGYGLSEDTYGDLIEDNVNNWADYYDETNYHLSLEGHAQFTYHHDANQYFTFTGDDDVYLYINDVRVLDIGAAHSIAKVSINLNDVAEACGLVDGEIYRFDFFYMERHGTAANFGIETNIQIVDPSMTTTKTGYQNGVNTGYNGYVDPNVPVVYEFGLENDSAVAISDLIFEDEKLGVYLINDENQFKLGNEITVETTDETTGETTTKTIVETTIDMLSLDFYVKGSDNSLVKDESRSIAAPNLTKAKLMEILGTGLAAGEKIVIYGFQHTIEDTEWEHREDDEGNRLTNDYFYNQLHTTAKDSLGKLLTGDDNWVVQKMDFTFEGFHVYEWAGHGVTLEVEDMLIPLQKAIDKKNAELDESADKFELVATKVDVAITADPDGVVNSKAVLGTIVVDEETEETKPIVTYTGTETGKDVFYYAISANVKYGDKTPTLTAIIPVTVYSYDVEDNTYVLDYGLEVELNGEQFGLLVNDTLSLDEEVNPNTTVATFLGIGDAVVATTADGEPITVTVTDPVFEKEYEKNVYVTKGDMAETIDKDYGIFTFDSESGSVMYTPDAIIDNTDTIAAYVQVMEEGAEKLTKFTGVVMHEFVTTAPASVVYYEENHPGITYVSEGENQWVHYETVDPDTGESLAGTEQSADPDQQYGYDENYENDISGDPLIDGENWTPGDVVETISMKLDDSDLDTFQDSVIAALNDYLGYSGSDSNGTVNILEVKETAEVMYFDFVGTGFEIISRTTNDQYAVLNVTVYEIDESGNIIQIEKKDADGNVVYETDENGDFVYETDAEGNIVYETDENGELVLDEDGNNIPVKIPVMINKIVGVRAVITESKGGDLYQVPIVSITGLDHGNYRVSVKAAGSSYNEETGTGKIRVLYIDGIRIYGPLSDGQALEYYNPAEYQAEVFEIQDLLAQKKLTFMGVALNDDDAVYLTDGYTAIENITPDPDTGVITGVLVEETDPTQYMKFGPNNELYLNGNEWVNLVALILTPIEEKNGVAYPDAARTVQIGAHRKLNDDSASNGSVYMTYGSDADMIMYGENAEGESTQIEINTGTEMYYTIKLDKLEPDANGNYLLFIGTNGSMFYDTTLALTNLKVAGYTVQLANLPLSLPDDGETGDETTEETSQGSESALPAMAYAFYAARRELYEANNPGEEIKVNENLEILGATLRAAKVARGRTATLTVKAGSEAQTIVVTDADGNEVTATRVVRKVSGSTVTFTFIWKITGTKGEAQKYTIRVYDADGLASVNEETVTVTVG